MYIWACRSDKRTALDTKGGPDKGPSGNLAEERKRKKKAGDEERRGEKRVSGFRDLRTLAYKAVARAHAGHEGPVAAPPVVAAAAQSCPGSVRLHAEKPSMVPLTCRGHECQ